VQSHKTRTPKPDLHANVPTPETVGPVSVQFLNADAQTRQASVGHVYPL
jgi:hypothetical protein